MLSIEEVVSLREVDACEWDTLAGNHVLASYGWLLTLEETSAGPDGHRYFLARSGGTLVAAVVCEFQKKSEGVGIMLFGRFAKAARYLGLGMLPSLVCGAPMGYQEPILLKPGLTDEQSKRIVAELVEGMEEIAEQRRWTVCFRGVRRESVTSAVLAKRGYLRNSEFPTAFLEVSPSWNTFGDFRRHLKKQHPRTAKNLGGERNRAKRVGLTVERLDAGSIPETKVHELMERHHVRLNSRPFPWSAEFFAQLKTRLPQNAVIYVGKIGDEIVGSSVALHDADQVSVMMIGINHDLGRAGAAYFNLGYNQPIEDAIAAGRRRVYFGKMVYEAKSRRGCDQVETDFYLCIWNIVQKRILRSCASLRSRMMEGMGVVPRKRVHGQSDGALA